MSAACGAPVAAKDASPFLERVTPLRDVRFKEHDRRMMHLTFGCRAALPEGLGLGNGPAYGFGRIQLLNEGKPVLISAGSETVLPEEVL